MSKILIFIELLLLQCFLYDFNLLLYYSKYMKAIFPNDNDFDMKNLYNVQLKIDLYFVPSWILSENNICDSKRNNNREYKIKQSSPIFFIDPWEMDM